MSKVVPVILCGGSGTRLWPLSRTDIPKQFLKLLDNHTLLQATVQRTLNITGALESDVVVVTLEAMKEETERQLHELSPQLTHHVLTEPEARNTAAAVAYATLYIKKHFGADALAWVLPSDHYVGDEEKLGDALREAVGVAKTGHLVTFGITPTRPETGYGYIRKAGRMDGNTAHHVGSFVEKPPHHVAVQFIATGKYLWSSGMHVFRVADAEENFLRHAPDVWMTVKNALLHGISDKRPALAEYRDARKEPFETAVLEKAQKIAVVPCNPQWSDIGSWESLWEIKPKNESGNAVKGRVVCEETINSFIMAQDRLVTCVGLKDIVVIETADSVLVADRRCNGSMKKLISALQRQGHREVSSPAALAAMLPSVTAVAV